MRVTKYNWKRFYAIMTKALHDRDWEKYERMMKKSAVFIRKLTTGKDLS